MYIIYANIQINIPISKNLVLSINVFLCIFRLSMMVLTEKMLLHPIAALYRHSMLDIDFLM